MIQWAFNLSKIKEKRILFITGRLGKGGAERITLHLINAILECGVDVGLVVQRSGGSYMPLLSPKCKVYKLSGSFRLFGLGWAIRLISLILLLYRIRPNVIYTNLWGTAFLIRQSLRFYLRPVQFIYAITSTLEVYSEHRREFENILKDECVTLILQTDRIKKKVESYRKSDKNIYVIPSIIDPNIVKSELADSGKGKLNVNKLVHVGRFVRVKRHDRLLQIAQDLKNRGIAFQLDLIGDGPLKNEIYNMSKEMALNNVVTFRGYQNNPFSWIARADVMLLTSDYEGMPLVLIEALTVGTPIVSTDVEFGPREIIENGVNGFVVAPKDDIQAFVNCVVTVLSDKTTFSENAKKSSERFYIQNYMEKYLDIMGIWSYFGKGSKKVGANG